MPRGRPTGTFPDPALRARAWHWLCVVQALAQVDKARQLDQQKHVLSRGLLPGPRFDQIRQDGYDPARVCAHANMSLLDHVASKRGFKATRPIYGHQFWKHLLERAPHWPDRDAWLVTQLRQHGIVRYVRVDEWHAMDLGLLPEPDPRAIEGAPPLDLDADRFATLDGLLLLLLLYREAQDAAHLHCAERLNLALQQSAETFATRFQYHNEIWDTWRLLIAARMVAWRPDLRPTLDALKSAAALLRQEDGVPECREPISSQKPKPHTRSDRRWRRRVWVRACNICLCRSDYATDFDYRDDSALFQWLTAHREAISRHRLRAVNLLMTGEDGSDIPPLCMPEALYASRQRPQMTDDERDEFGDTSIYDLIPVTVRTESDPGA